MKAEKFEGEEKTRDRARDNNGEVHSKSPRQVCGGRPGN